MSKTNKNRRCYTREFQKSVLKRLEPQTKDTVASLSDELSVSRTSIYQWIKDQHNELGHLKSTTRWTSEDKFT